MSLNDPIADALSKINNAVKALNKTVILSNSKFLINILSLLKKQNYVGSYKVVEDGKQDLIEVNLLGNINNCGIIKPRYPIKVDELESYEKRFLPAKDFGILIISTNQGLLSQNEAKNKNVGGALVAYCY